MGGHYKILPTLELLIIFVIISCAICDGQIQTMKLFKKTKWKKGGRLLSNPLGFILGNPSCNSVVEGRNLTGICYNEMECLLKGGQLAGYCPGGPPVLMGACCVFHTSSCSKTVTEKTAYFKNKSFPRNDLEPFQCLLNIRPRSDACWVSNSY